MVQLRWSRQCYCTWSSDKTDRENQQMSSKKEEILSKPVKCSHISFLFAGVLISHSGTDAKQTVQTKPVRMKGVTDQISRCVIKLCPVMATGLLQSRLKLNESILSMLMGTTNEAYSLMWFTPPPFFLVSCSGSVTRSLHPVRRPVSLAFFSFPLQLVTQVTQRVN